MNHYDMLEVSPKASPAVIKAAYKSLMQRFHPDKNLDDAALAQRSGLITQAYDTLSDAHKRAVYDECLDRAAAPKALPRRSQPTAQAAGYAAPGKPNAWYFWLIVLMIIGSGSVSLWLLRASPAQEQQISTASSGAASQRPPDTVPAPADSKAATTPDTEASTRTLRWISGLSVVLADGSMLTIPAITVQLGAVDPAEFTRYLDTHHASIQAQLKARLALAKPEELALTSGQQYLRRSIFDALIDITDTTGTRRFDLPPAAGGEAAPQYGVTGVLLPDAFLVK